MEVSRRSPSELVIESRPGKRAFVTGGSLICLAGLLVLTMTRTVVSLNCRRAGPMEGTIELNEQSLLSSTVRRVALANVTDVMIRTAATRGSGGVVLRTREGEFSLGALSSGQAPQLAAGMVQFISNPAIPELTIRQDFRLPIYALGAMMVLAGMFVLALSSQRVRCTFDGNGRRCSIETHSIFGLKRSEVPFSEIADVRAVAVGPRRRAKVVYLILNTGRRMHAGWPDASTNIAAMRAAIGLNSLQEVRR